MSKLAKDFEDYLSFDNSSETELSMKLTMTLTKLDNGQFTICFDTPVGRYSESINDYGDLYESLGHLFAEEDGIVNQLFR